jgi:predicted transposase/invertase (TIGR01784 family)
MEQRFEEGVSKGIEKGELKARVEIAKALLNSGMTKTQVISITGLKAGEF